jgi:surface antigen
MRQRLAAAAAVALAVAASGCQLSREQTGTVLGGAAGAAAGSAIGSGSGRTAAMIIGGLIGAAAGRNIGKHMDQQDRMQAAQTLENTKTGQSSSWTNPDTGSSYTMTPTQTYTRGDQPCRDFRMNADVDGEPSQVEGTACRQPDGSWKIVS